MNTSLIHFNQYYKFNTDLDIQWVDIDHSGYVNHSKYLSYFEFARMFFFSQIDFMNYTNGIGPIMKSIKNVYYKKPLTYPDTIIIGIKIDMTTVSEFSFEVEHAIFSTKQNLICTQGTVLICSYDYLKKKKVKIPININNSIEKFMVD